jgi:hypothetical protein
MAERDSERTRTLKGWLIIAALLGAVALSFFLDDLLGLFERRYRLVAVFPEAADLMVDAPVWVSGKSVGRVRSVELQPVTYDTLGQVAVTISLPRRVQDLVRTDSRASLTTTTLIGQRVIDISTGTSGHPPLQHGDTLQARLPREFAELTARLEEVQAAVDTMMEAVNVIRARLPERTGALQPAARQLALAQAELDVLLASIETGPGMRALRDPELRASVQRIASTIDAVQAMATGAAADAGTTAGELRAGFAGMLARADTLSTRMAALEQRLQDTDGFIGRFAQDTALQRAVNASRAELDSLIADARRNPFRFFRLRLF